MDMQKKYSVDTTLTAKRVCQLINNGKVADLPVDTATGTVFNAGITYYTSACTLDSTHVLVSYEDVSDNYYCYAVVLTINNGIITVGPETLIKNAYSVNISSCALSSTSAIITYQDYSTNYVYAKALAISGTTISVGTEAPVNNSGTCTNYDVVNVDTTKAVATWYYVSGGVSRAVVLTVSGTTISVGVSINVFANSSTYMRISKLSATQVLVIYVASGIALYAVVLTVSGATLTLGTPYLVNNLQTTYNGVAVLDPTHVVITFNYLNTTLQAITLTISGSTITKGTLYNIASTNSMYQSLCPISSTLAMLTYYSGTYLMGIILTINGDIITWTEPSPIFRITASFIDSCPVGSNGVLISYRDSSNASKGTATLLNVFNDGYVLTARSGKPIGIAQDTSGNVLLKGISTGHTGLIAGSNYYYDVLGNLTTDSTINTFVGTAISPTQLLIPDFIIE